MNPDEIRLTQARRFAYLQFVYEQWRRVTAGHLQSLPASVVREHLGIDRNEGDRIEEYLKGRGLIKYVTMGPSVAITPYGIDYVEEALAQPDKPTEYFPPINVLNIGQVINSQVQQGTTSSSQLGDWSGISADQLTSVMGELRALFELPLTDSQRRDLNAHVDTLAAQSRASTPSKSIIREALASARSIAEDVGAALVAAKIGQILFG